MKESTSRELARAIGSATKAARERRGWTQRDLAAELSQLDASWTAKRVGVLESDGVRADRLPYIAQLCAALGCGLNDLLADGVSVTIGDHSRTLTWVRDALAGQQQWDPPLSTGTAVDRIGADDAREVAKLAARAGLDDDAFTEWVESTFDGRSPMQVRDALAQLRRETPRREAQARRGHGSRKLVKMANSRHADPAARRAVSDYWLLMDGSLPGVSIVWDEQKSSDGHG